MIEPMAESKEPWLAPDTILDADFARHLHAFHGASDLSVKQFSKNLRGQNAQALRLSLQPFLKTLPAFTGIDGVTVQRSKHKAAALLLHASDLKPLHKRFGKDFDSRDHFRCFIERGNPQEVAHAIELTTSSKRFKKLQPRLQQILRNRMEVFQADRHLCVSHEVIASSMPDSHTASGSEVVDISPIHRHLRRVEESKHPDIIQCFQDALDRGLSRKFAIKEVGRLVSEMLHFGSEYTASCARIKSGNGLGISRAKQDSLGDGNSERATGKRKERIDGEHESDTGIAPSRAKKQKRELGLGMDGHTDGHEYLDAQSISHPSITRAEAQKPSAATLRKKTSTITKPSLVISEAERQLLADTFGPAALAATNRKSLPTERPDGPIDLVPMNQSTSSTMSGSSTDVDDLLKECLLSTSQRLVSKPEHDFTATARNRQDSGTAEMPEMALSSLARSSETKTSKKKSQKQRPARLSPASPQDAISGRIKPAAASSHGKHGDAGKSKRSQMEEALLLECLGKTPLHKKTDEAQSDNKTLASPSPAVDPKSSLIHPHEPSVSPSSKNVKKRKRTPAVKSLKSPGTEMLESSEIVHGEQGHHIGKSPTVKPERKKIRNYKPESIMSGGESTSSEDVQALLDSQLQPRRTATAAAPQAAPYAKSKRPFQHPMNCKAT